jgi:hypothetical protein
MKGSFSLDAFDPEIISKKQGRYCAGNPRSLLAKSDIDGQCAGEKCGPRRRGNTTFEIGNTIVRERLVYELRTHIEAKSLLHAIWRTDGSNGVATEMLGLEAGQRDTSMPGLTGFSVFNK